MENVFIDTNYFSSIDTAVGNLLQNNVSAHSIIQQLQTQFPELKKIIISYRPTGVHVTLTAHEPLCYVNNSFVLTPQGKLFPQNHFSPNEIHTIPLVSVAEQWLVNASPFVLSLLQNLPADFKKYYDLEVINEHCMYLVDKNKSQFSIVFAAAQKNISLLLHHCDLVKKSLDTKRSFDKNAQWVADTRFADYIVAYKKY
jgi:hypothetical protein